MELKPEAKAVAELDAVCDEYERAYRSGDDAFSGDQISDLDLWVERVAPALQPWLREELYALRQDLRSRCASDADGSPDGPVPEGVGRESWHAVTQCPTFQDLSYELKLSLAKGVEPREFDSGSALLRSGERASGLYLITSGRVQVVGGEQASRRRIDTDGAGSVLGEMSMLTGYPCSADVVATTPVQALVLPLDAFDALRNASPELEIALSQLVSKRLGHHRHDALCGKSLGGFRLQRCIGRGAMGVVYEAIDESGGMVRALKMLPHRFLYSPRVVSRFDQETRMLRQLEHPNIVGLQGHFVAYRTRFIVLDLYDGADLQTIIRCHGPIDESTARGVVGQIAAGLRYAHGQGVLHLDLKPANVLLNQEGRIAITDFGLSRLIEKGGGDQDCVGTPLYMPPEQFLMAEIGPHCDWYSFGCIIYELMSGKRLFHGDDSAALLEEKFRAPSSAWPHVDASDDFREHLRNALQPMLKYRSLDLETIATWARPVPELAIALDEQPSIVDN